MGLPWVLPSDHCTFLPAYLRLLCSSSLMPAAHGLGACLDFSPPALLTSGSLLCLPASYTDFLAFHLPGCISFLACLPAFRLGLWVHLTACLLILCLLPCSASQPAHSRVQIQHHQPGCQRSTGALGGTLPLMGSLRFSLEFLHFSV